MSLTLQETANKIARHLFTQGQQASEGGAGNCKYRTRSGLSCAVGCLIPDEDYGPAIEGASVSGLVQRYPDLAKILGLSSLGNDREVDIRFSLLSTLQNTHDNSSNWQSTERMRGQLIRDFRVFKLDTSVLETLSFKDR